MSDIVETLRTGVPEVGLAEDNCTELFDIDAANEVMAEAADHIAALEARNARLEEQVAQDRDRFQRMFEMEADPEMHELADKDLTGILQAMARDGAKRAAKMLATPTTKAEQARRAEMAFADSREALSRKKQAEQTND